MAERLIGRYEHNYFAGWSVGTKRGGKRWKRYFRDEKGPGGREKALERARAYRDKLLAKIGPATKVKRRVPRSSTGVVGVVRVEETSKAGETLVRFCASWPVVTGTNVRRSKRVSFSAGRWGEERAFRLAVRARKEGVRRYLEEGGLDAVNASKGRKGLTPKRLSALA